MKVAVVGAGIFGCTIAVDLARAGVEVDLFEASSDILDGATSRCQARLHRGYHYPRSKSTAIAAREASGKFAIRFPEAILQGRPHFYAIAPGSKTSPDEYIAFCDELSLSYTLVREPPMQLHSTELCLQVNEDLINVPLLRRLLRRDIFNAAVTLRLEQRVDPRQLANSYDSVVQATYGQPWSRPLRYEICEVVILELGRYGHESFVILDGDFSSLDPHGRFYALYDVQHSVHHAAIGLSPEIPAEYEDLLKRPMARTELSRRAAIIDSASRFLWALHPNGQGLSIYHGSKFSVRAVLPDVDDTDERPTLIERDANIVSVLSGKICTAVTAAQQVTEMVLGPAPS